MSKKKNKFIRQFRISRPNFARVIWAGCVIILILAMLIAAAFSVIAFFVPQSDTTTIDPELYRQLQEQIQNQTVTPQSPTVNTVAPTK